MEQVTIKEFGGKHNTAPVKANLLLNAEYRNSGLGITTETVNNVLYGLMRAGTITSAQYFELSVKVADTATALFNTQKELTEAEHNFQPDAVEVLPW